MGAMSLRRKGQSGAEDRSDDWNVTRVEGLSLITLRMVDKCKVEGTKEGGGTQQNYDNIDC